MLGVVSFARVERLLIGAARAAGSAAPDDEAAARWVDALFQRLPGPWTPNCLRRAAVLYYLLRAAGREVDLCIGVRRDEASALRAHAWLERDGAVYLESERGAERAELFRVIARFPSTEPLRQ